MCCSLSLCETCRTCVLRVQIWVWNLQLPPVLLPCRCIQDSQLNRLRVRAPFQEGLPLSQLKFKQYQLQSRLLRGSKKYIEAFTGLTSLYELTWRDVCLGTDADSWLENSSFGGSWDFPVVQMVINLPLRQETRVRYLGWEVPLEKGMAIHSSIPAWRIPWIEKPGGLQLVGLQRVGHDWATNTVHYFWRWMAWTWDKGKEGT